MIKTVYFRFLNIVMLLCLSFSIFSCINYLPCEGQDYVIDNSTPKELINKLNLFRVKHPEYSASIDHFNKDIPHYYIEIYFKDLKTFVEIDINTYKENLNSQIFLNFSKIKKLYFLDKETNFSKKFYCCIINLVRSCFWCQSNDST